MSAFSTRSALAAGASGGGRGIAETLGDGAAVDSAMAMRPATMLLFIMVSPDYCR